MKCIEVRFAQTVRAKSTQGDFCSERVIGASYDSENSSAYRASWMVTGVGYQAASYEPAKRSGADLLPRKNIGTFLQKNRHFPARAWDILVALFDCAQSLEARESGRA